MEASISLAKQVLRLLKGSLEKQETGVIEKQVFINAKQFS